MVAVLTFYKQSPFSREKHSALFEKLRNICWKSDKIALKSVTVETCYYVGVKERIDDDDVQLLKWLLTPVFSHESVREHTSLIQDKAATNKALLEIGPRLNVSTPFSTNVVAICHSCGLTNVERVECSTRYLLHFDNCNVSSDTKGKLIAALHDRMTEQLYINGVDEFNVYQNVTVPEHWYDVDILNCGRDALEDINNKLGLAFDDWDLNYYTRMFRDVLKRNPTNIECFDLAQSNSEHSRHWFFKGKLIIDGASIDNSLMKMVIDTQNKSSNKNNVIKFSDNSSAIYGFTVNVLKPSEVVEPSRFYSSTVERHIIFTAETHNFPTGVSPFSGATTGTGGRIRDVHAAGRGSHVVAGTAGYSFGNLNIPGYSLPWENAASEYPSNFASPLNIAIEASNGASDYGNKFGEPIIAGFARSFGMMLLNGERREWIKPIMFTGGIGQIDADMTNKMKPTNEMKIIKIGGPAYRIGVGGGAASSIHVQGSNDDSLDFDAVQRGDPEMAQRLNRFIRACLECPKKNPICSIHDQGAGGNGNVLKEICEPCGACIYADKFQLGDPTLSVLELWGAEYQESDAILVEQGDIDLIHKIAAREKCPICVVGVITTTGKVILKESDQQNESGCDIVTDKDPVDLQLSCCLPSDEQKIFSSNRLPILLEHLKLPPNVQVNDCLQRVLRLPSVASKRYLMNKVDRSVTGLIAQQQCVGPLHTPLADVAVTALSHFDQVGSATSIGEQPIKGLINPSAGARLSVAEALTNIVFANISARQDIKCSCNWMWPAKLPGECAAMYDACRAMCDIMSTVGIAADGGKDSLSMAAKVDDDVVKCPGTLVVSAYAPCIDINSTITPDLKCLSARGGLIHVMPSPASLMQLQKCRVGGSALAQVYSQLGNDVPDVDHPQLLNEAFDEIQSLIGSGDMKYLTAGHDVSDGGLITCILEMAFAGNCGVNVNIKSVCSPISTLFSEEVGWILETRLDVMDIVVQRFRNHDVYCQHIGYSVPSNQILLSVDDQIVLESSTSELRDAWEETSFKIDLLQATPSCVKEERIGMASRKSPAYKLTFDLPDRLFRGISNRRINVAVVREEGTNGDREMASAFYMAGFCVWDVTVHDLDNSQVDLDIFQGLAFPGGFSYADALGSAKGWAAAMNHNAKLKTSLDRFCNRADTFTFGVCNGCQLMALLGLVVPDTTMPTTDRKGKFHNPGVSLAVNNSERFESRFSTVKVPENCSSIMLRGMAGSVLGIWIAHSEGRFVFKNDQLKDATLNDNNVAMYYVDDDGQSTTSYPCNPNGSVDGIAGVCSVDGRHLAVMPHPERCILPWQWPWMPPKWKHIMNDPAKASPWFKMFSNAYDFCVKNHSKE